jgi:hypothetical protein
MGSLNWRGSLNQRRQFQPRDPVACDRLPGGCPKDIDESSTEKIEREQGMKLDETQIRELDAVIRDSLVALANDPHVVRWRAKENNWVSYFVMKHLLRQCRPDGILFDPAQIGIEVSVLQPKGYAKKGVRRDVVIWPSPGATCWNDDRVACQPLTILEWKVHRPNHPNPLVKKERQWLKRYCGQNSAVCYAVEVNATSDVTTICCFRFPDGDETAWLKLDCPPKST